MTTRYPQRRRGRTSLRGFTLIEVVLAMVVFLMMALMFAAAFPVAVRSARVSNNYAQATELAQHKIDHLRSAAFSDLSSSSQLQARGIIDSPQPAGYPVSNPAGFAAGAVQYTFTTTDGLTNYYPPGSTGVVTIAPDLTLTGTAVGQAKDITVTLTWTGGGASSGKYTTRAKIGKY